MKRIDIIFFLLLFIPCAVQGQIRRIVTSPSSMALQIPGYTEVNKINTKTISYTPPRLPSAPTPVDGDTTTIINKVYRYAEVITADITMADGNITTTKAGKVWTLRIHIPNALNIRLLFDSFDLSSTAEMYVFDERRTSLDSCIKNPILPIRPQSDSPPCLPIVLSSIS